MLDFLEYYASGFSTMPLYGIILIHLLMYTVLMSIILFAPPIRRRPLFKIILIILTTAYVSCLFWCTLSVLKLV